MTKKTKPGAKHAVAKPPLRAGSAGKAARAGQQKPAGAGNGRGADRNVKGCLGAGKVAKPGRLPKDAGKRVEPGASLRDSIVGKAGKVGGIAKESLPGWKNNAALKPGEVRKLASGEKAMVVSKPNIHQKAKALGLSKLVNQDTKPDFIIEIDPELFEASDKAGGRPTMLTGELASRVCIRIAQGDSLADVEKIEGMPSERTVMRWLASTRTDERGKIYEAFRQVYARAREMRASGRDREVGSVYQRLTNQSLPAAQRLDPQTARVAMEIQRALQEMEAPNIYSKRRLELTGKGGGPVEITDPKQVVKLNDDQLMELATKGVLIIEP